MRKPFDGGFQLTQRFGENPQIYAKFGMKGHNGLDYALPDNTPLVASISGTVIETNNDPTGYGLHIKIENDREGVLTAHLKEFKVKVRDRVIEGQFIGYSDNTGFSTGAHLHFAYFQKPRNRSNGYDGWIDPLPHFINSPPTMDGTQKKSFADKVVNALEGPQTNSGEFIKKLFAEKVIVNGQEILKVDQYIQEIVYRKEAKGKLDGLLRHINVTGDTNKLTLNDIILAVKTFYGNTADIERIKSAILALVQSYKG